jgi:hypothetical protein
MGSIDRGLTPKPRGRMSAADSQSMPIQPRRPSRGAPRAPLSACPLGLAIRDLHRAARPAVLPSTLWAVPLHHFATVLHDCSGEPPAVADERVGADRLGLLAAGRALISELHAPRHPSETMREPLANGRRTGHSGRLLSRLARAWRLLGRRFGRNRPTLGRFRPK